MNKTFKILVWLAVLAGIVYGAYRGIRIIRARQESARAAAATQKTAEPLKVGVVPVRLGKITQTVWVTGEVQPLKAVDVTPEVSGRLERLRLPDGTFIDEGVKVREGDVVAVVEHDLYEAAVQTAQAALMTARAGLERAKVNLAEARREKDRWRRLVAEGAGTQQQLDRAVTAFERAQAEEKLAEAQVEQAEAALAQAEINLDEATIKAPFSGIVSRKYVDEGAFVGPARPLFRLIDIREVEVTGGVAERHYKKLQIGKTRAVAEVDAYPGQEFGGFLSRIRPELEKATRTVAVTIRVRNEDGRLKPGMYARIRLVLEEHDNVLLVPDEALLSLEGETWVYVVNGGVASIRKVKLGLEEGDVNEVLDGLQPGEMIVVTGKEMLRDGAPVEAKEVQEVEAK